MVHMFIVIYMYVCIYLLYKEEIKTTHTELFLLNCGVHIVVRKAVTSLGLVNLI